MVKRDLEDLLDSDEKAFELFQSMPIYVQHKLREIPDSIRTREELSAYANKAMADGLTIDQYRTMFEDSSSNEIDFL